MRAGPLITIAITTGLVVAGEILDHRERLFGRPARPGIRWSYAGSLAALLFAIVAGALVWGRGG